MIYPQCEVVINFNIKKIKVDLKRIGTLKSTPELNEAFGHLVAEDAEIYPVEFYKTSTSAKIKIKTKIKDLNIVKSQENFNAWLEELNQATKKFLRTTETRIPFPESIVITLSEIPNYPVNVNSVKISNEQLTSLHDIHKYVNCIFLHIYNSDKIKSNVLGILLIKKLQVFKFVKNSEWAEIIENHLAADRDILECQEELIDKGFKEYAKL